VMTVSNELLKIGMCHLVCKQIESIPTNSVWNFVCKSRIKNMGTVWNFELVFDRVNVDKISTSANAAAEF
jgi:hypothetical protein